MPIVLFFSFMASPSAHRRFQPRGPIQSCNWAHATATAILDPSHICDLHCSFRQLWILNSMSETRGRTCILTETMSYPQLAEPEEKLLLFFFLIKDCSLKTLYGKIHIHLALGICGPTVLGHIIQGTWALADFGFHKAGEVGASRKKSYKDMEEWL